MISREDFIQIRVAEGFTVEQAKAEYDKISNPLLDETQKQPGDTRGDMMLRIAEAKQKNPDRGKSTLLILNCQRRISA